MGKLNFSDREGFDTSGPLRTEERKDGWYVVGGGLLLAVRGYLEGLQQITILLSRSITTNSGSAIGFVVVCDSLGGQQPVFRGDNDELMLFATEQEANADIDEFIADVKVSVAHRDMEEEYDRGDYSVFMVWKFNNLYLCKNMDAADDKTYCLKSLKDDDFS